MTGPHTTGRHASGPRTSTRGPVAALQVGAIAASLAAPAVARALGRVVGPRRARVATAVTLIAAGNALTALMERRRPFEPRWNEARDGDDVLDAAYLFVQAPLIGALTAPLKAAAGAQLSAALTARGRRSAWPTAAPLPVRLTYALVVSELAHYWWHRCGHGAAWPIHAVHHSSRRVYWLNSTKFHAADMVVDSILLTLPLTVLGMDDSTALAYYVFGGTFGKLQHSNIAGSSGPLGAVLSTPELHRTHHSLSAAERNSNFGARLIVWDRVFGTFEAADAPVREVGLVTEEPFPHTWLGQARFPLVEMGRRFRRAAA